MPEINNNYLYNASASKQLSDKKIKNQKAKQTNSVNSNFNSILQENILDDQGIIDKTQLCNGGSSEDEISMLLKDVGIQGKNLKKRPILEEFDKYKRLVGQLLSKIIKESESVSRKEVRNFFKKEKVTKIHLKIINKELLDLTGIFMGNQKDIIKIASKIDKIEGILIDTCS